MIERHKEYFTNSMYSKLVQKTSINRAHTNWKKVAGIPKNELFKAFDLLYL